MNCERLCCKYSSVLKYVIDCMLICILMVQAGNAPIHLAAWKGHVGAVELFINKGVHVNLLGQVSFISQLELLMVSSELDLCHLLVSLIHCVCSTDGLLFIMLLVMVILTL